MMQERLRSLRFQLFNSTFIAAGQKLVWTGLGFIALTLVFVRAIRVTAAKYPGYRASQLKMRALIRRLRV